jgi:tetratricopeptide (TPR) repeat protein
MRWKPGRVLIVEEGTPIAKTMNDINKQLDEAYSLAADRKDYVAALSACDVIIQAHPELIAPLRKKAQIYAHKGNFKQAIDEMSNVIQKGPAEPGDYFFRGWWNLEDDNATDAIEDLTKAIELGEQLSDDYFRESAHFFRAAAAARLGHYEQSLADCEHVRDDFLIYLKSGKVSKEQIVREAQAKRRK